MTTPHRARSTVGDIARSWLIQAEKATKTQRASGVCHKSAQNGARVGVGNAARSDFGGGEKATLNLVEVGNVSKSEGDSFY